VVWNNSNSYILIAIPMFLLMGEVILRSGSSKNFYTGIVKMTHRLPGGLLHANIVACAIFSAVSGSSVATAISCLKEISGYWLEGRAASGSGRRSCWEEKVNALDSNKLTICRYRERKLSHAG
jgi:hypothetical protein